MARLSVSSRSSASVAPDRPKGCCRVTGFRAVFVAKMIGAHASFLLGRYLLRGFIYKRLQKYARFRKLMGLSDQNSWKLGLALRYARDTASTQKRKNLRR